MSIDGIAREIANVDGHINSIERSIHPIDANINRKQKEAHSLLDKIAREEDFNYFNLSTKTGTKLQLTTPLKYQGQLKAAHQLWPQ